MDGSSSQQVELSIPLGSPALIGGIWGPGTNLHAFPCVKATSDAPKQSGNGASPASVSQVHGRMARGSHGFLKVSHGCAMPYPFMPCGLATRETALRPFQGWPAYKAGGIRPSSTSFDTPVTLRRTPLHRSNGAVTHSPPNSVNSSVSLINTSSKFKKLPPPVPLTQKTKLNFSNSLDCIGQS
jgi:hypothetical protein